MIRSLFTIAFLLFGFTTMAQYQFIENKGQWNKKALFKAHVDAGEIYLEKDGLRFLFYDGDQVEDFHEGKNLDSLLDCHTLKLKFLNAQKPSAIKKSVENATKYNYFLGNNRSRWASNVSAYERIVLENIYDGIDFEIYSYQYKIKYNFYVHPGADPSQIALQYLGADDVFERNGVINIHTSLRKIIEEQPYSFQENTDNKQVEVATKFKLDGNTLTFDIKGSYRKERMLVIDPTVVFATFSGSTADNFGFTATYDDLGNAYSGGTVYDLGFPTTLGAFQRRWNDGKDVDTRVGDIRRDIGILKYSDDGTKLLFATYIGGSHNEDPHSMVVNSKQELLVFGNTGSTDFPTTISAYDTSFNGLYDMYIAHLSADGTRMLNCTYIGGSGRDGLNGQQVLSGGFANNSELGFNYGDLYRGEIIVDLEDNVYVTSVTRSDNFPIGKTAYQKARGGSHDAVVFKMNKDLSDLTAGTYFGKSNNEATYGIGLDTKGNVFICGGTSSKGLVFPKTAFQDTFQTGDVDGIIVKFSNNLDTLLAGTYFGTTEKDQAYFIQIDKDDYVYITGQTYSDSFIVANTKYSQAKGKQFIAKLGNNLDSLYYSGTFGSGRKNPDVSPSAFLVDQCARIYFTGWGGSSNFGGRSQDLPIADSANAQKTTSLGSDFYLAVFAENMDTILYGSYFGGDISAEHVDGGTSRYNKAGIVYQSVCAGCSQGSSDFPVTKGVVSETNEAATGNLCNNALFKIDFDAPVLFAGFYIPEFACFENTITPENRSINALEYFWDFGDGFTSTKEIPSHTYSDTGSYTIRLIVKNIYSCPGLDTLTKDIYIYRKSDAAFASIPDDCGWAYDFKNTSPLAQTYNWSLGDGAFSKFENIAHRYNDTGSYVVRLLTDSGTACADSISTTLLIKDAGADFTYIPDSCEPYINFFDNSETSSKWLWEFEPGKFSSDNAPGYNFPDTGTYSVILRINQDKPCFDSVIKTVRVLNFTPEALFDLEIDSCNYSFTGINKSINTTSIKWLFGDTIKSDTLSFNVDTSGFYELKLVANPFSGCPDTSFRFITLQNNPVANFSLDIDTCLSKIETTNSSSDAKSYFWQVGSITSKQNSPTFTLPDTGTYYVQLITNPYSSCADTLIDTAIINVVKYAEFETEIVPCSNQLIVKNTSKNASSYSWNYGAKSGEYSIENDTIISYANNGAKTITLIIDENDESCSDTFELTLELIPPANAEFSFENKFCDSYFEFNSTSDAISYKWLLDGIEIGQTNTAARKLEDTLAHNISLIILDSNGCPDTLSETIRAQLLSEAAIIATVDSCSGLVQLNSNSIAANSYFWALEEDSISNKEQHSLQLQESGKPYIVYHIINKGNPCEDSAELNLQFNETIIEDLSIPNIFSPNNDGLNELAIVSGFNSNCDQIQLYIYDRWGVLVFEDLVSPYEWNGKNTNGEDVVTGVYFYILELNGQVKNGTVTIVR